MVASSGALEENILCSNKIEAPSELLDSDACTGIEIDHDMANNEATISSENRLPMNIGLKLLGIEPCYSAVGAARVREIYSSRASIVVLLATTTSISRS